MMFNTGEVCQYVRAIFSQIHVVLNININTCSIDHYGARIQGPPVVLNIIGSDKCNSVVESITRARSGQFL
jgi:hypothetical protein